MASATQCPEELYERALLRFVDRYECTGVRVSRHQRTSNAGNIIVFSFRTFMDLTQAKTPGVLRDNSDTQPGLLRLDAVTKTYLTDGQPVHALNGISLAVNRGSFVALVGRSGCGKSTLLNLGGAMDFPTTGQVLLDGVSTAELNDNGLTRLRREKVGFIFQSFQLLNTLTVLENVELPLLLAGEMNTRDRVLRQLDLVELAGLDARMPHQLSGGQMQRVAIARAMVHDPKLLLADEPTGNLDTQTGNLILQLLRRIADEQKTAILMATHSMEAAAISDCVVKMRDGLIEEVVAR
jgi:putative ABC transport system ATP-binding protein